MNEKLLEFAEQAGMSYLKFISEDSWQQVERFAELVRQDEREDLAVLAEEVGKGLAKAIRGRTE